jgi:hypothetical protein
MLSCMMFVGQNIIFATIDNLCSGQTIVLWFDDDNNLCFCHVHWPPLCPIASIPI